MEEGERRLREIERPLQRHELDAAGMRKTLEDPALRPRALVRLGWLGELEEASALFEEALGTSEWLEATREEADLDLPRAGFPRPSRCRGAADLNTYEMDVDGVIAALERAPGHPEAVALLSRERCRPTEPEAPKDPARRDRALEAIRTRRRTPEEKADAEAKLRELRHRR